MSSYDREDPGERGYRTDAASHRAVRYLAPGQYAAETQALAPTKPIEYQKAYGTGYNDPSRETGAVRTTEFQAAPLPLPDPGEELTPEKVPDYAPPSVPGPKPYPYQAPMRVPLPEWTPAFSSAVSIPPPKRGLSTNTKLAIGAAALVGLYFLARKKG
jgi:hypothetical protein